MYDEDQQHENRAMAVTAVTAVGIAFGAGILAITWGVMTIMQVIQ